MGYWSNYVGRVNDPSFAVGESIKFQDKKKLAALVDIVARFQAAGDFSLQAYDSAGVNEWIQDNCGIGVRMCDGSDLGMQYTLFAAVQPPQLDANNPIVSTMHKQVYQGNKDLDVYTKFIKDGALNGEFDDRNAVIRGDLSKITSQLYVTPEIFKGKANLTAYEIAAIILHEVGHVYWYLRTLMRGVVVNLLADAAANRMMQMESATERLKVIKDVGRMLDTKINQPETIAAEYKKENIYTHLVTQTLLERPNLLGGEGFGNRGWERAADDFAARMGAAPYLASALYKLETAEWFFLRHSSYRSYGAHLVSNMLEIGRVIVLGLTPPFGFVISTFIVAFGLMVNSPKNTIYDPPQERFETLRRNLVEELETLKGVNTKAANEQRKRTLDGIASLDKILLTVKDKDNIYSFIMKNLTAAGRKERDAIDYQRAVEKYMSNDLRVASSKIQDSIGG